MDDDVELGCEPLSLLLSHVNTDCRVPGWAVFIRANRVSRERIVNGGLFLVWPDLAQLRAIPGRTSFGQRAEYPDASHQQSEKQGR
jgi:hypothetical protein